MSLKEQLKYASQETISLKKLVELWAEETGEDQNTVFRFVTYLLRKLLRKDPHAFFWLRKDPDAFLFYDPLDSASIAVARRHAEKRRLAEKLIGRPRERPDKQVRLMFEHGIQKAQHCTVRRSVIVGLMKDEDAPIPNFLLPPSSRSNAKTTVPTSPLSKTEQRKASTQDRNDRWRDRFKELQNKHRKLSKKQIAKKMEKEPIAEGRPWSTILRVFNQAKTS